jgi:CheY-like chemotaxis protein
LPLLEGYEATEEILKFDPKVIIIAQTAYIGKKENEKCLAIGFKRFLQKPVDKDIVISELENIIRLNSTISSET